LAGGTKQDTPSNDFVLPEWADKRQGQSDNRPHVFLIPETKIRYCGEFHRIFVAECQLAMELDWQ